ncbi:MAG TPA: hypothetical protein VGA50_04800 [Kiloniellales bacterium]
MPDPALDPDEPFPDLLAVATEPAHRGFLYQHAIGLAVAGWRVEIHDVAASPHAYTNLEAWRPASVCGVPAIASEIHVNGSRP